MSKIIKNPLLSNFNLKNLQNHSKLLLMRHGESEYNYGIKNIEKIKLDSMVEFEKARAKYKFDPGLCDTNLTPKGKLQCYRAGLNISNTKIKFIFSSPIYRALQSTQEFLKGYAQNNSDIPKVIVNPYLFEKIEDNCDILDNIYRNMEHFEYWDWSDFEKFHHLPIYPMLYCDTILDDNGQVIFSNNNDYHNECVKYFKKYLTYNHKEIIIRGMKKLDKKEYFIESSIKTIERLLQFKKSLKEFLKTHPMKDDEKILLVGHSIVFKHLTSIDLHSDNLYPVEKEENFVHLENAEVVSLKFEDF